MDTLALVLVALAVVVALVVVLSYARGSKAKPPCVLLCGPCGGGKTLLFHRLVDGATFVDTLSSMQPNEGLLPTSDDAPRRPVVVVDYPGHARLRAGFADVLRRAVSIVFVFDASAALAQVKPAAELLYAILATFASETGGEPSASSSRRHRGGAPPILVVCNKADKPAAKTPQRVKLMLMNEIDTLRKTAGTIAATGDDDDDNLDAKKPAVLLGKEGHFFNFDHHSPCPISFVAFSAKRDDPAKRANPVLSFILGEDAAE